MIRKIALLVFGTLLSFNAFAASDANLSSTIINSIKQHTNLSKLENPIAIIYGGQDFSHPQIAIANESIWSGQPTLVG